NMTVYLPMYMGMNAIPENFAQGNGNMLEFSWNSAFWVFNWVANQAYYRYSFMIEDIRKVQTELEDRYEATTPAIDKAALALYQEDPEMAKAFLTDYVHNQSRIAVERWKKLGEFLMVKYLDGNLHEEKDGIFLRNEHGNPKPAQFPGYDEGYYKRIVDETGDKLKMIEIPKE
ncbi:MAG: C69 family dipeptidase, partial [Bacteroidales bacterium]|nr:C69 family dipeptidase [Bacteroidales bacterium]